MSYQPPYTITNQILSLVAQISECLGRLSVNPLLLQGYYDAINRSTLKADSEPFISFMLQMALNALQETEANAPKSPLKLNNCEKC